MKKKRSILHGLLVCIMFSLVTLMNMNEVKAYVESFNGDCGETEEDNVTYSYADGVLTFEGTGQMMNYAKTNVTARPWHAVKDECTKVVFKGDGLRIGDWALKDFKATTSIVLEDGVYSIGAHSFDYCSGIKTVVIPSSLKEIGQVAFSYCTGLESMTIPSTVEKLDIATFQRCSALKTVSIECSGSAFIDTYGYVYGGPGMNMFMGCSSLTDVVIPDGLETIGYQMFWKCEKLERVVIPSSVKTIGYLAFNGCKKLKSVTLPNGLISVGRCAFQACESLEHIELPDSVQFIGSLAFNHCIGLNDTVFHIPDSVRQIGGTELGDGVLATHVFYNCGKDDTFTAFEMTDGGNAYYKVVDGILYSTDGLLVSIPRGKTFEDNTYVMPDFVTDVAECSFSRNRNISTVVISDNLEIYDAPVASSKRATDLNSCNSLGKALYTHTNVTNLCAKESNKMYTSKNGSIYSKDGTKLICVPIALLDVSIAPGTVYVGDMAINLRGLDGSTTDVTKTSINIPDSVRYIGDTCLSRLNEDNAVVTVGASNIAYRANGNTIEKTNVWSTSYNIDIDTSDEATYPVSKITVTYGQHINNSFGAANNDREFMYWKDNLDNKWNKYGGLFLYPDATTVKAVWAAEVESINTSSLVTYSEASNEDINFSGINISLPKNITLKKVDGSTKKDGSFSLASDLDFKVSLTEEISSNAYVIISVKDQVYDTPEVQIVLKDNNGLRDDVHVACSSECVVFDDLQSILVGDYIEKSISLLASGVNSGSDYSCICTIQTDIRYVMD